MFSKRLTSISRVSVVDLPSFMQNLADTSFNFVMYHSQNKTRSQKNHLWKPATKQFYSDYQFSDWERSHQPGHRTQRVSQWQPANQPPRQAQAKHCSRSNASSAFFIKATRQESQHSSSQPRTRSPLRSCTFSGPTQTIKCWIPHTHVKTMCVHSVVSHGRLMQ
jgi:hypothetical protein